MSGVQRLTIVRYAGFAGAVLLAVAAYLGGALVELEIGVTPLKILRGENGPLIIACWLVGTALMTGAWWAARDAVQSTRWALVTTGLWLLPLLFAPPLASRDVYAYACQGATYAAGFNPYEQGVSALPCPWLDSISRIWRDTPAPYGPLFVLIAGGVVAATDNLTTIIATFRVIAVLGVGLTAATLPVLARRCGVPAGRALWIGLACPLVAIHLVSGAHNDALMIGLVLAGLALLVTRPGRAWAMVGAGALLGLAVAVKATAGVVVPFAALLALPAAFRWRDLVRYGGVVVAGALGAMVAVTLVAGRGFGWIAGLSSSGDTIQWSSPPTAVGQTISYVPRLFGVHFDAIPAARLVGMLVLLVFLVALWWRSRPAVAPGGPSRDEAGTSGAGGAGAADAAGTAVPAASGDLGRDPLTAAAIALVATVALSPVFHPWYLTWPLALVAATTTRLRWFVGVCAVACFLVLPDGTGLPRYTKFPGAPLMAILVVLVGIRVWRWWRTAPRSTGPAPVPAHGREAGDR
ncbi:polyprenol phosphomannose-dependent alpha 1,6 mannosyltransferase MptB [Polymorphospora sp. NPDC051019]|uniref:polyprenol phosphomannose-dependent alpha 1,6 mannosyltransferase MptB n=1 Tax=Polymorphospora sp. NPDC051019 TaxID=3155725 RepID=UPI00344AB753